MRKIKFSKSDYIVFLNLIAVVVSFIAYLTCDYYYKDENNSYYFSSMIVNYTSIAGAGMALFVPVSGEAFGKRWLTRQEKVIHYLVYVFVFVITLFYKVATTVRHVDDIWLSLLSLGITTVIWLITVFKGPRSESRELIKAGCPDPYIYKDDSTALITFGVGAYWYSKREYERLCRIYIKTAKEFSGKATKREIEYIVRDRIMLAKSRTSSILLIIAFVLLGVYLFTLPFTDEEIRSFLMLPIAVCQISGFIMVAKNLHDPYTPNESRELNNKETDE